MAQLRVLLGFANAADHDLEETAGAVLHPTKGIYGNPTIYPAPPVAKADLQTALTNFTLAIAAQAQGGPQSTAAKDQAREVLIELLRKLASYVQQVIQDHDAYGLAELLLSGFEAVSNNRTQTPLETPTILELVNSGEGRLTLRVKAVPNTRMYDLQKKATTDADYVGAGLFGSTRGMEATGLLPGMMYTFRVRALGGSTGQSEWSDPVSHRSL
jgi:hypothetical protein